MIDEDCFESRVGEQCEVQLNNGPSFYPPEPKSLRKKLRHETRGLILLTIKKFCEKVISERRQIWRRNWFCTFCLQFLHSDDVTFDISMGKFHKFQGSWSEKSKWDLIYFFYFKQFSSPLRIMRNSHTFCMFFFPGWGRKICLKSLGETCTSSTNSKETFSSLFQYSPSTQLDSQQ